MAGFRRDEIDITAQQNVLIVAGKKRDGDDTNFIHRGIATRSFERQFALAGHIQVRSADLKDGLLSVELMREIPETMKPKKINIGSGAQQGPQHGRISDDGPASQQTISVKAESA